MRLLFLGSIPIVLTFLGCGGSDGKLTCQSNADCLGGYLCDSAQSRICLRECTVATVANDCLAAQYCDVAVAADKGVCRDGDAAAEPGGDSTAGD